MRAPRSYVYVEPETFPYRFVTRNAVVPDDAAPAEVRAALLAAMIDPDGPLAVRSGAPLRAEVRYQQAVFSLS